MDNCFSKDILDVLFNCDKDGCLFTTESYDIEYKESLDIDADLLKAMNGLANNKGGYIICGVSPNNRQLKGLSEEKINFYNTYIDSEKMRGKILSFCQPNMEYKHYLHNIGTSKFVLFYIPESKVKPHIFNKVDGSVIKVGDIFYRYNDSIRKIQYSELSAIIENKRVAEQEKWMKFLGAIAKIGLDNVIIIDGKNGKFISTNSDNQGVRIDEDLLMKFKLIQEGRFNEINGDPTLKIIGNIKLKSDSGYYELSTDIGNALDINKTHPYRYCDLVDEIINQKIMSKDGVEYTKENLKRYKIEAFIENNKFLSEEYCYPVKLSAKQNSKRFSMKALNKCIEFLQNITLEDLNTYKKELKND